jgi:hypothetical protein
MGALAVAPPGGQDATDLAGRPGVAAAAGSRAPIGQPGSALGAIASQPLVGGRPGYPKALGGLGWWPAELSDALHQQQPAELGQPRITMAHEGPLPARSLNSPSRPRGPSTVNNPHGNYN